MAGVTLVDEDLDNIFYGDEPDEHQLPRKKVPMGDVYEASRAGDVERLKHLLEQGVNVNARDVWDSVALYYACLAGHLDAARILLERGAICSENTFDGDRCHYAALNLHVRKLLKAFEARPPPLDPLPRSFRELFVSFDANCRYLEGNPVLPSENIVGNAVDLKEQANGKPSVDTFAADSLSSSYGEREDDLAPDFILYVGGRPVGAHRALLSARSPFFKKQFETVWKDRHEVRFANQKLIYSALFSLVHFFYTDRLDVAVDDMEDLVRICKVCGCLALQKALERELTHQKYADYKSVKGVDDSQKRFILQGSALPENERLSAAMHHLFTFTMMNSGSRPSEIVDTEKDGARVGEGKPLKASSVGLEASINSAKSNGMEENQEDEQTERLESALRECSISKQDENYEEDHADVCFLVEGERFRCHRFILGARSEYFKARFSRTKAFKEGLEGPEGKPEKGSLPVLQEHDLSAGAFEKVLEYIYTDTVKEVDPDQAEEIFDAASRYLLFSLKRAVTDALMPQLETASPADLCRWLLLADMYGVWKLREHCLDAMAVNFEIFVATPEFRQMLRRLPPPSGELTERTTAPKAPGEEGRDAEDNVLDDLREKWLAEEGAELEWRDESAREFDRRLELLVGTAEEEEMEENRETV